jgi:hypothetical protein
MNTHTKMTRSFLLSLTAAMALIGATVLAGCVGAGEPGEPTAGETANDQAEPEAAQARLDDFRSLMTVDEDGSVHVDMPLTPSSEETLEGALGSGPGLLKNVTCVGSETGTRICCDATHCCINVLNHISCG